MRTQPEGSAGTSGERSGGDKAWDARRRGGCEKNTRSKGSGRGKRTGDGHDTSGQVTSLDALIDSLDAMCVFVKKVHCVVANFIETFDEMHEMASQRLECHWRVRFGDGKAG